MSPLWGSIKLSHNHLETSTHPRLHGTQITTQVPSAGKADIWEEIADKAPTFKVSNSAWQVPKVPYETGNAACLRGVQFTTVFDPSGISAL